MTHNQNERFQIIEDARHHRVEEALTAYSNEATNAHYVRQDSETAQHNRQQEVIAAEQNAINRMAVVETARHNQESERYNWANLSETTRSHRANEAIGRTQAQASLISAGAAVMQAEASQLNALTNQQSLVETQRHNKVNEQLSSISTASESELKRSQATLNRAKVTTETAQRDYLKAQTQSIQGGSWYEQQQTQNWQTEREFKATQNKKDRQNATINTAINTAGRLGSSVINKLPSINLGFGSSAGYPSSVPADFWD